MQSSHIGGGSSGGGGGGEGELSRSGLSRIRSAPATWIETLLDEDEEEGLKPNLCLTELLTGNSAGITSRDSFELPSSVEQGLYNHQAGFHRQNSSPANFLSGPGTGTDGFFSSFGIPANYNYLSPNVDISPTKRSRDMEAQFSSQLKEEQMSGGVSGMVDINMDKLLEDSVPCRVRAKRGCATHPRSIAERVRRTRISDRIRRLQELVPNMDKVRVIALSKLSRKRILILTIGDCEASKQTNTADMLEEAVEYVKTLQSQIQELTEQQRRCRCKPKEEQ